MTALRESALVYPIIMTGHLTGMALFGGMICITDMRLLGWAMRDTPVKDVIDQLRVWKQIGFVHGGRLRRHAAGIESGAVLLQPVLLDQNGVVAPGRSSRAGVSQGVCESTAFPSRAKVAACLSLFIWVGLVTAGRSIAYWDVPDELTPVYGSNGPTTHHIRK